MGRPKRVDGELVVLVALVLEHIVMVCCVVSGAGCLLFGRCWPQNLEMCVYVHLRVSTIPLFTFVMDLVGKETGQRLLTMVKGFFWQA
jgi:hypothetical protein